MSTYRYFKPWKEMHVIHGIFWNPTRVQTWLCLERSSIISLKWKYGLRTWIVEFGKGTGKKAALSSWQSHGITTLVWWWCSRRSRLCAVFWTVHILSTASNGVPMLSVILHHEWGSRGLNQSWWTYVNRFHLTIKPQIVMKLFIHTKRSTNIEL